MYLSQCPSVVAMRRFLVEKKSRFPTLVFVCASRLRTLFFSFPLYSLSSRHISPPEDASYRGVHILRRSLADSLPSFHHVPLFSVRPELTLAPSRAPHQMATSIHGLGRHLCAGVTGFRPRDPKESLGGTIWMSIRVCVSG